jgi:hypothetical protein
MFKKPIDHDFDRWVEAIAGELGSSTEKGFGLLNEAMQIFEKKVSPKAAASSENAPAKEAKAIMSEKTYIAMANAQATVDRSRSLLKSVQLKSDGWLKGGPGGLSLDMKVADRLSLSNKLV